MAVDYRIIADGSLAVIRYCGEITVAQITAAQKEYLADPAFRAGTPELAIMEEVEAIEPKYVDVRELIATLSAANSQAGAIPKISVFAPRDLPFAISRMFQLLAEHGNEMQVGVHRTEFEALAWLGRPERKISDLPD